MERLSSEFLVTFKISITQMSQCHSLTESEVTWALRNYFERKEGVITKRNGGNMTISIVGDIICTAKG